MNSIVLVPFGPLFARVVRCRPMNIIVALLEDSRAHFATMSFICLPPGPMIFFTTWNLHQAKQQSAEPL